MTDIVRYTIVPLDPAAHLFRVTCTTSHPDPAGQRFSLPAWIPGSYMIREFSRNIVELRASCADEEIVCRKIDKATWACAPVVGELTVTCDVYAWDLSVRAAHLDNTHGYFNGASVFLAVLGQEEKICHVRILRPEGESFKAWQVATAMRCLPGTALWTFGDYWAENYDELIDHPVEMGLFERAGFQACGVPHDIVVSGRHRADMARLCRDLQKICETQIRFFGEPSPVDRYVFLVMVVGEGYGGLEHRASTSLLAARDDLPLLHDAPDRIKKEYRNFLGLCSHEYFHTWNIKRIKPAAFIPYELSKESYTQQLWAFEGFTSYYDDLMLVRAGLIRAERYLQLLGENITRVLRAPGRFRQSVAESSFDAWTKFYRQDENAPNAIVSYYAKGALVAMVLDMEIRRRTRHARSLDDVMRLLWQRHGINGVGVEEDGIQKLAEEICGESLAEFFAQAVYGTKDLALADALAEAGVGVNFRAADGQADKGGRPGRVGHEYPALGIRTAAVDGFGARIQHCFTGGPAMLAGLSAGDVLVAINGLRVTHHNLEKILSGFQAGEAIGVHAFRRDELREYTATLSSPPHDTCFLTWLNDQQPSAQAVAWLDGVTLIQTSQRSAG